MQEPYEANFFVDFSNSKDKSMLYCTFMGGDAKITHIKTSTHNGRKLAIFKDSYGNALPQFLFGSFEEIFVMDMRFFTYNAIDYFKENGITDLLFANNAFHATTKSTVTHYENFLTQGRQTAPQETTGTTPVSVPAATGVTVTGISPQVTAPPVTTTVPPVTAVPTTTSPPVTTSTAPVTTSVTSVTTTTAQPAVTEPSKTTTKSKSETTSKTEKAKSKSETTAKSEKAKSKSETTAKSEKAKSKSETTSKPKKGKSETTAKQETTPKKTAETTVPAGAASTSGETIGDTD